MAPYRIVNVIFLLAVGGGCATVPVDSDDPLYRSGAAAFNAHQPATAREDLRKFVHATCMGGMRRRPVAGCHRAVWMQGLADLEARNPAQALADTQIFDWLGEEPMAFEPSVPELRRRATAALKAAWDSKDRSAVLHVFYRDDVGQAVHLEQLWLAVDKGPPIEVPPERWITAAPVIDVAVPAGPHLIEGRATFTASYRGGSVNVALSTSHVSIAKSGAPVRLLAHTFEGSREVPGEPSALSRVTFEIGPVP